MPEQGIKVVFKVQARPGGAADLKSLLLDLAAASRKESGCTDYQVLQNSADAHEFVVIEAWSSDAALDAHMTTTHVQAALSKAPSLLAKGLERGVYSAVV